MSNTEKLQQSISCEKNAKNQKREEEISKIEKNIKWYTRCAWGFVAFGIVFALLPLVVCNIMGMALNDYGDYTGGVVASLWSLAGLFMVYIAFLGQRIDLLNQQTEISLTREEMQAQREAMEEQAQEAKAQAEALKEQAELMRAQRNEMKQSNALAYGQQFTIFLREWNLMGSELEMLNDEKKLKGRGLFNEYIRRVDNIKEQQSHNATDISNIEEDQTIKKWHDFEDKDFTTYGKYFKMIFDIIEVIDSYPIEKFDKLNYVKLLKCNMSVHEARVFFYHSLREKYKKQRGLLEKYHFFSGFELKEVLGLNNLAWDRFYNKSAFEEMPNDDSDQPSA